MLLALLTTLPLLATAHAVPARAAGLDGGTEELRHLRSWIQRARRTRAGVDAERRTELEEVLARIVERDREHPLSPELSEEWIGGLIELAALGEERGRRRGARATASPFGSETAPGESWIGIRDLALGALHGRIRADPEGLGERLAASLQLPQAVEYKSLRRTLAILEALRGQHLAPTMAPLVSIVDAVAENGSEEASRRALEALAGWPDPRVTDFLLGRAEADVGSVGDLTRHLERLPSPPGERALDRARTLGARLLLSESWRDAVRGLSLVEQIDSERAVPVLIEALTLWGRREGTELSSRRVRGALVAELRRRSGRSLGADPDPWKRWWELVQAGRIALPTTTDGHGELYSSAPFFGLRLETDRVIFVLDNSGSMASPFRTDGSTRYEAAISELLGFLRASGPATRFQVALFSDRGRLWQRTPLHATEKNLARVERWLRSRHPGGGTMLFEGLREALDLDRDGHLTNPYPEVDTVVVLCDGETQEGKGWVLPWVRRENESAQLVFQCVRIGHAGDGTLEALAEATGGRCVEVE